MPTLTALPTTIQAGDSYAITLSLSAYPAPTWALSLALNGVSSLTVTSTASGTSHLLTLTNTATAALGAGLYQYQLRATSSGAVDTLEAGRVPVLADVSTLGAGAGVSYWETLKAAAETALLAMMDGGGVQMAMIGSRQMMFRSPDECLRTIAQCDRKLAALRRGSAFGRVSVAFAR